MRSLAAGELEIKVEAQLTIFIQPAGGKLRKMRANSFVEQWRVSASTAPLSPLPDITGRGTFTMKIAMTCRNSFAHGTLMLAPIGLTACQDVTSPQSARGKVSTDVTTALGQLRRTLRAESANGMEVVLLNNTHILLNGRKVKMADHAVNKSHRERSRQHLDVYGTECYT